jgi:peptidoglycan/LPS O-acetylase OafA/YrhL
VANLGNFGVATFFLLSGFLLYRPFVAATFGGRDAPDPFRYLRRRVVRIWPAYALALGAYIALGLDTTRQTGPDYYFSLLTLTQVYRKAYGFVGLAVAWTLCIEMAFYLVLPLLAAAIRGIARAAGGATSMRMKLEAQLVGLGTLAAITFIYRWYVAGPAQVDNQAFALSMFHLWLPNYFDWFALGMVMAVAVAWKDQGRALPPALTRLAAHGWPCWLVTLGCYVALTLVRGDEVAKEDTVGMFLRFGLNGLAALFFLLPGIFGPARHPINRMLSSLVPMYLGTVSYGIYLWHRVVFEKVRIGHTAGRDQIGFWAMLGIVLALSILSASVSYYLLERPLQRLNARFDRRRSGARASGRRDGTGDTARREGAGEAARRDSGRGSGNGQPGHEYDPRWRGRPTTAGSEVR